MLPHKKRKRVIHSKVKIHDRSQLEAVFDYALTRVKKGDPSRPTKLSYQVDAYLFMPVAFGLGSSNYPKDFFYEDLRPYIRLRAPALSMKDMLGRKKIDTIFSRLERFTKNIKAGHIEQSPRLLIREVRIFACSYTAYCAKQIEKRTQKLAQQKLKNTEKAEACATNLLKVVHKSHYILRQWRSLLKHILQDEKLFLPEFKEDLRRIDEYLTYRFRDFLTEAHTEISKAHLLQTQAPVIAKLKALTRYEWIYNTKQNYIWMSQKTPPRLKEEFVERRSTLKKYIWEPLYLEVRSKPTFAFLQHLSAMIAALIAGSWAIFAELAINVNSRSGFQAGKMELRGLLFLTAFALAYAFKDRIKEIGRKYVRSHLFRWLPDNYEKIYYKTFAGHKVHVGNFSEVTKFLKHGQLPLEVKQAVLPKLNERTRLPIIGDRVLHYKKTIQIRTQFFHTFFPKVRALHDILRLSVDRILPRLSNPNVSHTHLRKDGSIEKIDFPVLYHFNLVLHYRRRLGGKFSDYEAMDAYRFSISKNGLENVECLTEEKNVIQ